MRETLKKLVGVYGATGAEKKVRDVIRDMVNPYVDEIKTDAMGNLICVKKGAGRRIMLAGHMDHIGLVVTDADEHGFLRVTNVGYINQHVSLCRRVVFENGVSGVLANEIEDFKHEDNNLQKLFVDIGAGTREEALSIVSIGDAAVYAPDVFDMGDLISGPAMDNRSGCAVIIGVLKALSERSCINEIIAVFTVQEEVGCRGARAAAYDLNPDVGIAVDITLSGDTPKGEKIAVGVGKGPTVKILDRSLICTPAVVRELEAAAKRADVAYQREVLTAGGTDAGAIQLTKGGIPSGVVSIPCRYAHSAAETVSVSDMEGAVRLLTEFAVASAV